MIIVREEAESHMREWVELFIQEIENIESFYCSKFQEYCLEFEHHRDTLLKKKYGHTKAYKNNLMRPTGLE